MGTAHHGLGFRFGRCFSSGGGLLETAPQPEGQGNQGYPEKQSQHGGSSCLESKRQCSEALGESPAAGHEDNKKVSVTLSAFNFIKSLIIHIPEKSFNMLRYYGAYAKPFSSLPDIRRCMNRIHLKFYRHNLRRWAIRLELSFQKDPLTCIGGERMKFFCIYDPHASPINPEFVLKY